jgi:type I restriction enzyme S subunit
MVPKGWERKLFKELIKLDRGSSPRPIVDFITDSDEGVNWIKIGDTKGEDLYINSTKQKITKDGAKKSRKVSKGEIVLSNSMSYGKPYILNIDGYIHDGWFVIRQYEKNFDKQYLLQYLGSELIQNQYKSLAAGGVVSNISSDLVYSAKAIVPPLSEQQKIAKILSTWDKAISTTERLIENSQHQKKALMQQLLTGKQRLLSIETEFSIREGFAKSKLGSLPNDWSLALISKFYWFQEGPGVRKHQFTENGVKLLNGTNIQKSRVDLDNTRTHISVDEAYGGYKHFLADSGDLIIACSGISVDRFDEKIAFLEDKHLPLCMNTSTMRFKVKKNAKASLSFLRYFMMSPLFKNQIRRQITGSAQLNFGPSHVGKCYIAIPSFEEQERIAKVLANADKEIDLLQQQLDDLHQEKKALMQQLLTGKRRVLVD